MRPMPARLFQIDAFTTRPFTGNPAAVCVLDTPGPPEWMAAVAAETDLPATAFIAPVDHPDSDWALRWFCGPVELALCGHGTLATSHVLLHELGWDRDTIRYATGAGTLTARSAGGGSIELDFPAHQPSPAPGDASVAAAALYRDGSAPAVETHRGFLDLLVVVPSPGDVARVAIDTATLATIEARCVIVSAAAGAGEGADIVSRVFHPTGGGEDQVTGSAHCLLGPFWAERLGRSPLQAVQASPRRGELQVEVRGDRVALTGRAVTVLRSELAEALIPGAPA
jgi:PhzF family phenazine biosynthesis protein